MPASAGDATSASQHSYRYVAAGENGFIFYDAPTVIMEGALTTVWTIFIYEPLLENANGVLMRYEMEKFAFDCPSRTFVVRSGKQYSDAGVLLNSFDSKVMTVPPEPTSIVLQSLSHYIYYDVCENNHLDVPPISNLDSAISFTKSAFPKMHGEFGIKRLPDFSDIPSNDAKSNESQSGK
jgi:hypothetical protein